MNANTVRFGNVRSALTQTSDGALNFIRRWFDAVSKIIKHLYEYYNCGISQFHFYGAHEVKRTTRLSFIVQTQNLYLLRLT